jgi:hypothetical protein
VLYSSPQVKKDYECNELTTIVKMTEKILITKQRIRSQSYTDAFLSVEWLNSPQGAEARSRVLQVRDALEKLMKAHDDNAEDLDEQREAVNQLLARYTYVPQVGSSWRVDMVPQIQPKAGADSLSVTMSGELVAYGYGPESLAVDGDHDSFIVSEGYVVAALGRLADQRELYKVRLCEQCQSRWRISQREMDRFCSDLCRITSFQNSEDYKDRQQKHQANYRAKNKAPRN